MENEEKKQQIGNFTGFLMITTALIFDLIQAGINLIPIIGQIFSTIIAFLAFGIFYLWFKLNGVKFAKAKRVGALGGGFILELIPILNILPGWTLSVFLIIADTKIKI